MINDLSTGQAAVQCACSWLRAISMTRRITSPESSITATCVAAACTGSAADWAAPSTPSNARIIVAELTNSTTLRWDASPETDVAGYEIVWRDTAALNWEHAQDVGTDTEGTVPRTKDNSTFGVRAYDRDGYRSPVAFPLPAQQ